MNVKMFFEFPGILILIGVILLLIAIIFGIIANKQQENEVDDPTLNDENLNIVLGSEETTDEKKMLFKKKNKIEEIKEEPTEVVEPTQTEEEVKIFEPIIEPSSIAKEETAVEKVVEETPLTEVHNDPFSTMLPTEDTPVNDVTKIDDITTFDDVFKKEFDNALESIIKDPTAEEIAQNAEIESIKEKYNISDEPEQVIQEPQVIQESIQTVETPIQPIEDQALSVNMFANLREETNIPEKVEDNIIHPIIEDEFKTQEIKIEPSFEPEIKKINSYDTSDAAFNNAINHALGEEVVPLEEVKPIYGGIKPTDTIDLSFLNATKKSLYNEDTKNN